MPAIRSDLGVTDSVSADFVKGPRPNPFADAEDIPALLAQLAGAASVCWIPAPEGQFDPHTARQVCEEAEVRLYEMLRAQPLLGLASNAQLDAELKTRHDMGHTDPEYRTAP